jgi:hypothetical protein
MKGSRYIVAAMSIGSALVALPAAAQSGGSDSCSTPNTAVTVGALVPDGRQSSVSSPLAVRFFPNGWSSR